MGVTETVILIAVICYFVIIYAVIGLVFALKAIEGYKLTRRDKFIVFVVVPVFWFPALLIGRIDKWRKR